MHLVSEARLRDAQLMVSELVANAVRHGGDGEHPVRLGCEPTGGLSQREILACVVAGAVARSAYLVRVTTPREFLLYVQTARPAAIVSTPRGVLLAALANAPKVARELLTSQDPGDQADASVVYRSVSSILARGILDRDDQLFDAGIASALEIYRIGDFSVSLRSKPPDLEASLWESLVIELFALGGLAVAEEAWQRVRGLALQQPDPDNDYYLSWLRHGQVHSSRSSLDPADSLPHLAARRLGELREGFASEDALAAVCRFDLLAALIVAEAVAADTSRDLKRDAYPSAAVCSEALVEPLVIDALRDQQSDVRQVVFAGDDAGLRQALRHYNEHAVAEAAYHRAPGAPWEWRGLSDHRTWAFIRGGEMWEDYRVG